MVKTTKKVSAKNARTMLADVNPTHCFWLSNGNSLHSIEQLRDALKEMDDGVFFHHVSSERNDFCNWINDVVSDNQLAKALKRIKSKKGAYAKINKRVIELKKLVKPQEKKTAKKKRKKPQVKK